MEEGILLSVVVPVYKVEPYIDKCLTSLILEDSSLMEQMEVIIVNDGTPDNSAELSRKYVDRYPHTFKQIDKENGGHGSAWNVGLKEATGKYLRFLDSDDWFTCLDSLLRDLKKIDADLVFNPFVREYVYKNEQETIEVPTMNGYPSKIHSSMWGKTKWGYSTVNFWGLTYKTKILKPLYPLFAENTMFDDYILTWAPLVYGRTYHSLDYPVYHYYIGRPDQSMSLTKSKKGALSYKKCFSQFVSVRSHINTSGIPSDLLNCIDSSIAGYANFVFPYMLSLPYKEAASQMSYLWNGYLKGLKNKSPFVKRYMLMPFPFFYTIELIRQLLK